MFLSDEQQIPTAKALVRYIYSQQLEGDVDRSEVMRLMLLADEFSVPNLRHACMLHLAGTPLQQWSVEERQLLCSCWAGVRNDSLAWGGAGGGRQGPFRQLRSVLHAAGGCACG